MSEATLNPAPGWFGKLPHLGDFASRRLPDTFVRGRDQVRNAFAAAAGAALIQETFHVQAK